MLKKNGMERLGMYPYNYYHVYRTQPTLWSPGEATQNLNQFQNQYIRVHITGLGWVVAQLLGFDAATGVVTLNVYRPGSHVPEFMRINRAELTGLTPLGFTPPPEVTGGAGGGGGTPGGPTGQPGGGAPGGGGGMPNPGAGTPGGKPPWCAYMPWHPYCQ